MELHIYQDDEIGCFESIMKLACHLLDSQACHTRELYVTPVTNT